MLSKTSKGRYLDFKRASFASQKGVNWKPIYALFVCSLRILFTKSYVLTTIIEILKGRSMQNWNVLLLLCLSFLQLTSNSSICLPNNRSSVTLSFIYSVYKNSSTRQLVNSSTRLPSNRSPVTLSSTYPVYKQLVNLSTRYLVYQVIVLLLLCLSSTLSTSNSLTRLLVNLSTKQTLLYLLFFL